MADCYIGLIKLAAAINQISDENNLKLDAIRIFNHRYKELDYDVYLLGYFLHPAYRGLGFKRKVFRRICKIAADYWKALGNDEYSCSNLLANFRKYKHNKEPYDMEYKSKCETPLNWWLTFDEENLYLIDFAIKLFSIMPSQAGCKRNFSTLE